MPNRPGVWRITPPDQQGRRRGDAIERDPGERGDGDTAPRGGEHGGDGDGPSPRNPWPPRDLSRRGPVATARPVRRGPVATARPVPSRPRARARPLSARRGRTAAAASARGSGDRAPPHRRRGDERDRIDSVVPPAVLTKNGAEHGSFRPPGSNARPGTAARDRTGCGPARRAPEPAGSPSSPLNSPRGAVKVTTASATPATAVAIHSHRSWRECGRAPVGIACGSSDGGGAVVVVARPARVAARHEYHARPTGQMTCAGARIGSRRGCDRQPFHDTQRVTWKRSGPAGREIRYDAAPAERVPPSSPRKMYGW